MHNYNKWFCQISVNRVSFFQCAIIVLTSVC